MPRKQVEEGAEEKELCGHQNLHWTGEGEMTCELPKGHAGNHEADYTMRAPTSRNPDRAAKIEEEAVRTKSRASWKDDAGKTVEELNAPVVAEAEELGRQARARQAEIQGILKATGEIPR